MLKQAVIILFILLSSQLNAADSVTVYISLTNNAGYPIINADLEMTLLPNQEVIRLKTNSLGKANYRVAYLGNRSCEFKIKYREDLYAFNNNYQIPELYEKPELRIKLKYEPKYLVLNDVEFTFPEVTLQCKSHRELNDLVEMLNLKPNMKVRLVGHCSMLNEQESNLSASQNMAEQAKDFLVKEGINENRIKTSGLGSKLPIVGNHVPQFKKRNTRLEVKVLSD